MPAVGVIGAPIQTQKLCSCFLGRPSLLSISGIVKPGEYYTPFPCGLTSFNKEIASALITLPNKGACGFKR